MNIQEWKQQGKPFNVILHGDCMDLMSELGENEIDLAVVDPPYGIGVNKMTLGSGKYKTNKTWDSTIPSGYYFFELFRISQNQIVFGGNYFIEKLKNTSCFIVWDKNNGNSDFADCELAWTSFNSPTRKFKNTWCGSSAYQQEGMNKIHPTQKPIALYRWLLQNYAKPGQLILDTHSGSGSLACACHLEKFDFIAIEKDYDYWLASVKRYEELKSQGTLF